MSPVSVSRMFRPNSALEPTARLRLAAVHAQVVLRTRGHDPWLERCDPASVLADRRFERHRRRIRVDWLAEARAAVRSIGTERKGKAMSARQAISKDGTRIGWVMVGEGEPIVLVHGGGRPHAVGGVRRAAGRSLQPPP